VAKGGIIVRLIDIVLILLFGFISISEIDRKSKVRLSETKEIPIVKVDQEQILVIGIVSPNEYVVEKEQEIVFRELEPLLQYIKYEKEEYKKRGFKMKVRIRSNWYLPNKHAMDIAVFCESNDIDRGLDVRISGGK
jgi:biopolymer transport protein ExbD